ncbi:hypothetical protein [Pararhodobacter sp.]
MAKPDIGKGQHVADAGIGAALHAGVAGSCPSRNMPCAVDREIREAMAVDQPQGFFTLAVTAR